MLVVMPTLLLSALYEHETIRKLSKDIVSYRS
jgi:hypothetical protein